MLLPLFGRSLAAIASTFVERKRAQEEIREFSEVLEQPVAERTGSLEAANKEQEAFSSPAAGACGGLCNRLGITEGRIVVLRRPRRARKGCSRKRHG
jgi:hypothetical protein